VDLVGPWKVKTPRCTKTLRCFTATYPATSWPEIVEIPDKQSQTVMDAFHHNWICRSPRPMQVTFDNGSEFKSVFKEMCDNLGIKCSPTTSYNPQGNLLLMLLIVTFYAAWCCYHYYIKSRCSGLLSGARCHSMATNSKKYCLIDVVITEVPYYL
jgi:hypothetical protein